AYCVKWACSNIAVDDADASESQRPKADFGMSFAVHRSTGPDDDSCSILCHVVPLPVLLAKSSRKRVCAFCGMRRRPTCNLVVALKPYGGILDGEAVRQLTANVGGYVALKRPGGRIDCCQEQECRQHDRAHNKRDKVIPQR